MEMKKVRATRPIVFQAVRREEDEEFMAPANREYELNKGRGYIEDVPEPEPEPDEPEAEEAAEEAEPEPAEEAEEEPEAEVPEPDEEEREEPEWPMAMEPGEYLKRHPDGDHADAARAVLEARGEEVPE